MHCKPCLRLYPAFRPPRAKFTAPAFYVLAAAALSACGGAGDEGDAAVAETHAAAALATSTRSIDSSGEARDFAGRSINAVFFFDEVMSTLLDGTLGVVPVNLPSTLAMTAQAAKKSLSGTYDSGCFLGQASFKFVDADASGTLTPGDHGDFTAKDCRTDLFVTNGYDGKVKVEIVSGRNIDRHLFLYDPGAVRVQMDTSALTLGSDRVLKARYVFSSSAKKAGVLDQTISMPQLSYTAGSASLKFSKVKFRIRNFEGLDQFSGSVSTRIAGGDVQARLSLAKAAEVDALGSRFQPRKGTLRSETEHFTLDAKFNAGGEAALKVDNGNDGKIDRSAKASASRLDSALIP